MFRYWHSDMGDKLNWKSAEAESPEKFIEKYHREHLWTYDTDQGGEDTIIFAIMSPDGELRYFRLYYEWNIDYRDDGDGDGVHFHVDNPYCITEINAGDAGAIPGDRDWLVLPRSYRACTCGR
jgi:hypothetical protein